MQGLKLVDPKLGFPAGVWQILEIAYKDGYFVIKVTNLREGTKTYWATESGEIITFNTRGEAERCLVRFQEIVTSLDLSPYPPIPF